MSIRFQWSPYATASADVTTIPPLLIRIWLYMPLSFLYSLLSLLQYQLPSHTKHFPVSVSLPLAACCPSFVCLPMPCSEPLLFKEHSAYRKGHNVYCSIPSALFDSRPSLLGFSLLFALFSRFEFPNSWALLISCIGLLVGSNHF